MKEAIKIAIDGGWKEMEQSWYNFPLNEMVKLELVMGTISKDDTRVNLSSIFLDPLFWQALGKEEGWQIWQLNLRGGITNDYQWLKHWHDFIDHLAEGGNADEFFTSLLK